MHPKNSKTTIDSSPISPLQYATILVCFLMNILDGMDVLVISYCAPAIAQSWNVSPETLGIVFSAGLAGMTLGALLLAPFRRSYRTKKYDFTQRGADGDEYLSYGLFHFGIYIDRASIFEWYRHWEHAGEYGSFGGRIYSE